MPVKHNFHSGRDDSGDSGAIQPSHFNQDHVLTGMLALLDVLAALPNTVLTINASGQAFLKPIGDIASIDSPHFTGTPTSTTPPLGDSSTRIANMEAVRAEINALIGTAPGALDTLGEIADALNDDASFAAAVTSALAVRLRFDAAQGLNATQQLQARTNVGINQMVALPTATDFNTVTTTGTYVTSQSNSTNTPTSPTAHYWYLEVLNYNVSFTYQRATLYETSPIETWERTQVAGSWSAWRQTIRLDATNKLPAVDGSQLTGVVPTGALLYSTGQALSAAQKTQAQQNMALAATIRGHIDGLNFSTSGPSTSVTISAGVAVDTTTADAMVLAAAMTKTTAVWAAGSGVGGLDTGAIVNNAPYHFFLIKNPTTGAVDIVYSGSPTTPTMPSGYTMKRRIGSALTNGAGQWRPMVSLGDEFIYATPNADIATSTLSTAATLFPLSVPTGIQVRAKLRGLCNNAAAGSLLINSPDEAATATNTPSGNLSAIFLASSVNATVPETVVRTNTSGQVRAVSSAASTFLNMVTVGWLDPRGMNA